MTRSVHMWFRWYSHVIICRFCMWFTVCDVHMWYSHVIIFRFCMWFFACDVHMWFYRMWCSHVICLCDLPHVLFTCGVHMLIFFPSTCDVHMWFTHMWFTRMWCSHMIIFVNHMWCLKKNITCDVTPKSHMVFPWDVTWVFYMVQCDPM